MRGAGAVAGDIKQRKSNLLDALRGDIMTMQLEPGSDLDETTLSAAYGLSRTPLREGLLQLAGEGYVDLRKNRGARVSDFSHKTLRSFFLAAPMIYSATSRLAAQNARVDQIEALKSAQEVFRAALKGGSTQERALSNNRFHAIIGEMADNPYLLPALNRLLIDHARISMTFYRQSNGRVTDNATTACDQHDAMIAAIKARDEQALDKLATDHWNLSRHQIELFVMPSGLDVPLGQVATA
ncbi:MAG: GntR family transcriptional regulator [Rhodobacteraceae bacterium]|nr:GntR family transcriptional regulator [Paracoccaceae bacterium]